MLSLGQLGKWRIHFQRQFVSKSGLGRGFWEGDDHIGTVMNKQVVIREMSGSRKDDQKGLLSPGWIFSTPIIVKTSTSRASKTKYQAREMLWRCWVLLLLPCGFFPVDKWKGWEREMKRLKKRRVRTQRKLQRDGALDYINVRRNCDGLRCVPQREDSWRKCLISSRCRKWPQVL